MTNSVGASYTTTIGSGTQVTGVYLQPGYTLQNQGTVGIGYNPSNGNHYGGVTAVSTGSVQGVSIENYGLITGLDNGIVLNAGGTITNHAGATIAASGYSFYSYFGHQTYLFGKGITASGGALVLANAGTISGRYFFAVSASAGGTITNQTGGVISGQTDGVNISGGGYVVNQAGALIGGGNYGVALSGGGYLENAGTISGTNYAVKLGTPHETLIVDQGAVFNGRVDGGGGNLVLGTATSGVIGSQYLGGASAQFQNFSPVLTIESGGRWAVLAGSTIGSGTTLDVQGTLVNAGSIGTGLNYGVLLEGGTVVNQIGGTISGYRGGINGYGIVNNGGLIAGTGNVGHGVVLTQGGTIINQAGGSILAHGNTSAVYNGYGFANVTNAGYIGGGESGLILYGSGQGAAATIVNQIGGTIEGSNLGFYVGRGSGSLVNGGLINTTGSATNAAFFYGDASVTNQSTGTIVAHGSGIHQAGVYVFDTGSVVNAGTIQGGGVGVWLATGSVDNQIGGSISGATYGIDAAYTAGVTNAGTVSGGVLLQAGGSVTNTDTGVIVVPAYAAVPAILAEGAATIVNAGVIESPTTGIDLRAGGSVTNLVDGRIFALGQGSGPGIDLEAGGTVTNAGEIFASLGVVATGGYVANNGVIESLGGPAVSMSGGTIVNSGMIGSITGTAVQFGTVASTLVITAGATFDGSVVGSGTVANTLELRGIGGAFGGLGTQFGGFGTLVADAEAQWAITGANTVGAGFVVQEGAGAVLTVGGTLQVGGKLVLGSSGTLAVGSTGTVEVGTVGNAKAGSVTVDGGKTLTGSGTVAAPVLDKGTVLASGGTLSVVGNVTGGGTIAISSGAVLSAGGKLAEKGLVFLAGGDETAVLGAPTKVTTTIGGFAATDSIDALGFVATSLSFAGQTLTLHNARGATLSLKFAGSLASSDFAFATDHHGGTLITHA